MNLNEQAQLEEFKRNPDHILNIKNGSKELNKELIKVHPFAIKYIEDQDKELHILAMQHLNKGRKAPYTEMVFNYFKDPDQEIKTMAMERFPEIVDFIKKYNPELNDDEVYDVLCKVTFK